MTDIPDDMLLRQTGDGSFTLFHTGFEEDFHSHMGAWQETEQLYLQLSGLKTWMRNAPPQPAGVLDVGLGLGYNAMGALQTWFAAPQPPSMLLLSLEIHAGLVASLASGEMAWSKDFTQDMLGWCRSLRETAHGREAVFTHDSGTTMTWRILLGDATKMPLADFAAGYPLRFIFQDAFSPTKNGELWTVDWFKKIRALSAPDVCLATYSVSKIVRYNLPASGWLITKVRAGTKKRHWIMAHIDRRTDAQKAADEAALAKIRTATGTRATDAP